MDRRDFLKVLGAGTVGAVGAAALPSLLSESGMPKVDAATLVPVPVDNSLSGKKVIVVGGGMAGTTAAKYLRLWGGSGLEVTLIEQNPEYISNIMSNMVVVGERTIDSLHYKYDTLMNWYGVTVVTGTVASVDPGAKSVTLDGGATYTADALVLAPGLEFTTNKLGPDYDVALTPHAWQAGDQSVQLAGQLAGMTNGDNVIVTIPKAPYRCPPGPYERACVIADWLYTNKPASKLYLLDANATIQAQATNFTNAFNGQNARGYKVTYIPSVTNLAVDSTAKSVTYTIGTDTTVQTLSAGVLNPIPPMQAPKILQDAGLCTANASGMLFAPVSALTFQADGHPGVHVVGDSSSVPGGVPKAGHIGNQEGKTAASAIIRKLLNPSAADDTDVVLNSACYTPITRPTAISQGTATWLSAVYQYDSGQAKMVPAAGQPKAAGSATTSNYSNMLTWFRAVMSDTFS